jgi:hypothetical protein
MSNDESMTKPENRDPLVPTARNFAASPPAPDVPAIFGVRTSGFLRPSSFVLRHFLTLGCLLSPAKLLACVACYGQSDSPLAEGMNMGILFLLGVIGLVLGGFVTFFIYLARRSAAVAAARQAADSSISSP